MFSFTIEHRTKASAVVIVIGTFNSAGVVTGSIVTGLSKIFAALCIDQTGLRAGASQSVSGGTITLAGLTSNDTGVWVAFGAD